MAVHDGSTVIVAPSCQPKKLFHPPLCRSRPVPPTTTHVGGPFFPLLSGNPLSLSEFPLFSPELPTPLARVFPLSFSPFRISGIIICLTPVSFPHSFYRLERKMMIPGQVPFFAPLRFVFSFAYRWPRKSSPLVSGVLTVVYSPPPPQYFKSDFSGRLMFFSPH